MKRACLVAAATAGLLGCGYRPGLGGALWDVVVLGLYGLGFLALNTIFWGVVVALSEPASPRNSVVPQPRPTPPPSPDPAEVYLDQLRTYEAQLRTRVQATARRVEQKQAAVRQLWNDHGQ